MRRTATAMALALVLAGCGGGHENHAPSAAEAESTFAPPAEIAEPVSVPWRLAGTDGPLLELVVAGGDCVSFQDVDVVETAQAVTIEARAVPMPGTPCAADPATEQSPSVLAKPLGSRRLVHAPLSAAWTGPKTLGKDVRTPLR